MSTWPSETDPEKKRVPDAASESRLLEIRREAESKGRVDNPRRSVPKVLPSHAPALRPDTTAFHC